MAEEIYTISAYTENCPGVLHRITTSFTKRKINVESLTVSETETKGISLFTIVVKVDRGMISTIIKQLKRIIEVRSVFAYEEHEVLSTEIALIRVKTSSLDDRAKIETLALRYNGEIAHVDAGAVVVQARGSTEKIESLYRLLEPHGIIEFVKSGRIAISKQAGLGLEA
jgi:acetolactate synthase-1/3 small subunit